MARDLHPIRRVTKSRRRKVNMVRISKKKKYKNTHGKKQREIKFRREKPFSLNRILQKKDSSKKNIAATATTSTEDVKYTTAARIYRAIISYYFVKGENEFRYSELAEWLIKDKTNPIKDEYLSSHISRSAIKAHLRRTLASDDDSYIADLVEVALLTVGKKPGLKNEREETNVYRFTPQGRIMAYLIYYSSTFGNPKAKSSNEEAVRAILTEYIEFLKIIESYLSDWLAEFYSVALQKGYGEEIVYNSWLLLEEIGSRYDIKVPDVGEMFRTVQMRLIRHPNTKEKFADVWVESLKRFPENIQAIIMMQDKTVAESNILVKIAPREYQELYFKYRGDYNFFTLCAFCPQCKIWYPVKIGYFAYRGTMQKHNTKGFCKKCNQYTMDLSDNVEFRGTDAKLRDGKLWHLLGISAPPDYRQLNLFPRALYYILWFQQPPLFDMIRFFSCNPKFCHFL